MKRKKLFKKEQLWKVGRILISSILLYFLFYNIDWNVFKNFLKTDSIFFLFSLPIAFLINIFFSSIRWRVILENLGVHEKLTKLATVYLISSFWTNFLPSTIGGDGYRFLALRSRHVEKDDEILASILLDRAYGFLALIIFNFLLALYFIDEIKNTDFLIWSEITIAAGLFFIFILWTQRNFIIRFQKFLPSIAGKILAKLHQIVNLVRQQKPRTVLIALLMSAFFLTISSFAAIVYYFMAGVTGHNTFIAYTFTLSSILSALPVSINGLGLVELSQTLTMASQNISKEAVLFAAILARIMGLFNSLLGGIAYMIETWVQR